MACELPAPAPIKRTHVVIGTEPRTCAEHGPYEAKHWDLQPKPAPIAGKPYPAVLGSFWGNCPRCDAVWQMEADQHDAAIQGGTTMRDQLIAARNAAANIPPRFKDADIFRWQHQMDQQRRVWDWVRDYCITFSDALEQGRCCTFSGGQGTGKTLLACGMLRYVMEKGGTALYSTASEISARIRSTYNRDSHETEQQAIAAYSKVDLLVIDEVGRQTDTLHEQQLLFRVLDDRYRNLRPVVVVSNLNRQALCDFLGVAVWDRLREAGGTVHNFDWPSQRSGQRKREDS